MFVTSPWQILDKHTTVNMLCSKCTCHLISYLRLQDLWCDISVRYLFSQSKSTKQNVWSQIIKWVSHCCSMLNEQTHSLPHFTITLGLCLNFFHLHVQKPNLEEKKLFIQTNSFIIFTCLNPVLLVSVLQASGLV
jgi:hypothetical protein